MEDVIAAITQAKKVWGHNDKIPANAAALILDTMTSQRFVDWYEDIFVPRYIEESLMSRDEILADIVQLFNIHPMTQVVHPATSIAPYLDA